MFYTYLNFKILLELNLHVRTDIILKIIHTINYQIYIYFVYKYYFENFTCIEIYFDKTVLIIYSPLTLFSY